MALSPMNALAAPARLLAGLLALAPLALAAQDAPIPPLPEEKTVEGVPDTEIVIRTTEDAQIEEYRYRGRVYMAKVKPAGGAPAYYLIDRDGNGTLETRHKGPYDPVIVPNWVLFSW
ncbi:MAG: DUF2782 domain-containing protein [Halothiobacillaceae bacterium]|jgi:hypothetical protein|nr:DUF2782 domain-containing protein [Halothiobacillaceae bacterium]